MESIKYFHGNWISIQNKILDPISNTFSIHWFIVFSFLFFVFCFYLPQRFKVWIELLDLSDSLKYFIPSVPISFSIPNIYSKKGLEKIELITYFR